MQSALIRTVGASMVLEAPTMRLCLESAEILPFFMIFLFLFKVYDCILKRTCHCLSSFTARLQWLTINKFLNALPIRPKRSRWSEMRSLTEWGTLPYVYIYIYCICEETACCEKNLIFWSIYCSEFENHLYHFTCLNLERTLWKNLRFWSKICQIEWPSWRRRSGGTLRDNYCWWNKSLTTTYTLED